MDEEEGVDVTPVTFCTTQQLIEELTNRVTATALCYVNEHTGKTTIVTSGDRLLVAGLVEEISTFVKVRNDRVWNDYLDAEEEDYG